MQITAMAIANVLQSVPGAADVPVNRPRSPDEHRSTGPRLRGMDSVFGVQNVLTIAVGGREAGLVFEGDRRFPSRAPEPLAEP
jgi:cobalt-zinc-cadmium resistance protein CzcA